MPQITFILHHVEMDSLEVAFKEEKKKSKIVRLRLGKFVISYCSHSSSDMANVSHYKIFALIMSSVDFFSDHIIYRKKLQRFITYGSSFETFFTMIPVRNAFHCNLRVSILFHL